jgi:hypothetical protein
MEWLPIARFEGDSAAAPFDSVSEPRGVVPSRKVTVPVGMTVPAEATVDFNVTGCPERDAF